MIIAGYIMFFILLTFYLKKLDYKKISRKMLIKGIVMGIMSIIITVIISIFINAQSHYGYNHELKINYFINVFVYAALVEEISKFLALKIYNPTKKNDYVIYSLIIGITFWLVENIVYGLGGDYYIQWKNRLIHPGHISYQVLMGILLYISSLHKSKSKRIISIVLSILLTTFIHALFNCLRGYGYFQISKSFVSFYITFFEYYIIIVGLYVFKKKIGDNLEKN